ncbi:MAG TPA: TonB family protein [Terriglobia bacterium]|nr:TonB family protein [Terriglobia bacterium]
MRFYRCGLCFALGLALAASAAVAAERSPAEAARVADRVLARAIIIDTHADTPQMMLDEGYDLADPASPFMISLPKARQGHLGAEFFSIWVDVDWPPQDLIHRALDLIDAVNTQVALHSADVEMARTADDIVRIHRAGKLAALMGIEGGHIIEDDPRALDIYYRLGARYMTLTHTKDNQLGDSSTDKPKWNGLSPFGREIVERMNRLGMMVDISHVSDATFYAAVALSKAPVIASHSSCRALCNAPRDMTDDMIRALAKNGGVMDINFYPSFLDQAYRDAEAKVSKQEDVEVDAATKQWASDRKRQAEEIRKIWARYDAQFPDPSYTRIADHIDHAVKIGGVDHVGLGSDFDGIPDAPRGMEDCSKLPALVQELARRGYSEEDLEKILGGNLLRVMREVEATARQMQPEAPASNRPAERVQDGVYSVGGDVAAPQVIYSPQPSYSEEARKAKRSATELLSIVVDSKGSVADVELVKPVGMGLDEKAIEAVKTWKFKPALKKGMPVAARLLVEVSFKLY